MTAGAFEKKRVSARAAASKDAEERTNLAATDAVIMRVRDYDEPLANVLGELRGSIASILSRNCSRKADDAIDG